MEKAVFYGVFLHCEESRKTLGLARAQAPDNPNIQIQADLIDASLYDQEGNDAKAFEQLTAVLSNYYQRLTTEPDLKFAYQDLQIRRGLAAVGIGRFQEAIPLLNESLSFPLKPKHMGNVLFGLGQCYSELGEYESAREYLLRALSTRLTSEAEGGAHMRLGIAYAKRGFLKEAKQEFQLCEERVNAYGLEPRKIYRWLSWVCNGLGERLQSKKYADLARPI